MTDHDRAAGRETVAVFHRADDMEQAVAELLQAGFHRNDISLLAGAETVERKLGHAFRRVEELEDDAAAPRTAYVSDRTIQRLGTVIFDGLAYLGAATAAGAMVASGGAIAGAVIAAIMAGGAGGLVGSVLADILDHRHAEHLQEQLDRGGLLIWVRTPESSREARAQQILLKHGGDHVHAHVLPPPED